MSESTLSAWHSTIAVMGPPLEHAEQLVGRVGVGEVHLIVCECLLVGTPIHPHVVAAPTRRTHVPAVVEEAISNHGRDARPPADPRDQRPLRDVEVVLTAEVSETPVGGGGR